MKNLDIVIADLSNPDHANAVVDLTDHYARDEMGLNRPLRDAVMEKLISELKTFSGYIGFIAFAGGEPAGVANCVYSFSTFYAAKVINIQDLAVKPTFRGKGIGEALMNAVEEQAKEENCKKITLEVREDNRARSLYERFGFEYGEPKMFFMEKKIG
ncbi:MAG: GNAT family N-acetyltransferase [Balneolaceae bacterium]|nr:MAG: GNAT family N-acetyltransferase [Balneolaceae bacterium]